MKKMITLKRLLFVCLLGLFSMNTHAQQQIGNSGFENWDDLGSDNEEPTNWNSFMTADCALVSFICGSAQSQHVEQSTDAHSGSFSARIWSTEPISGTIANGNLTVGRVHIGSITANDPSNYNFTDIANADFHQVLTSKPDSLVVWVKFNPVNAGDSARISATIHDNYNYRDPEDASATPHVVAKAVKNYGTTSGAWKRISIPFDYIGPATNPEYILITFTTNKDPGGGSKDDEVFIDDVELIYNTPTTTEDVVIAPSTQQVLDEGEQGTVLTATETPNAATSRQWMSATTSGGPYTAIAGETATTYTPQFPTAGTYYVVCESDFSGTKVISNEVEIIVQSTTTNSVVISPSGQQMLNEGEQGAVLTATETPSAATSRQWMSGTTSGGPYTVITGETATTYTPQFATAGTYYVVCQSDFSGSLLFSNEVEIIVEQTSGIEENTTSSIMIYAVDNQLKVNLENADLKNATIKVVDVSGKVIAESSLNSNALNSITLNVPAGIYFYAIQNTTSFYNGKVFIR